MKESMVKDSRDGSEGVKDRIRSINYFYKHGETIENKDMWKYL